MRERRFLIWTVLLLVVILLNLPAPAVLRIETGGRTYLSPFQNVLWALLDRGSRYVSLIGGLKESRAERHDLELALAMAQERLIRFEEIQRENDALRQQLGFQRRSRRRLLPAQVMLRGDISGWWQTVRLNRGSEDGVQNNQAVITADGLVGRTINVSRDTCDVLLITDPNSRVSCKFVRTGAFGLVRGTGGRQTRDGGLEMLYAAGPVVMDYIPRDQVLWPHDEVMTSGLGGVFPEGLLLGYVIRSDVDDSGLFRRSEISPAADLANLRYVFILQDVHRPGLLVESQPEEVETGALP